MYQRSVLHSLRLNLIGANRRLLHYSGAATTASRLGMPDLAIATLNDFVEAGQMHASLDPTVPVIADADTGYVCIPN